MSLFEKVKGAVALARQARPVEQPKSGGQKPQATPVKSRAPLYIVAAEKIGGVFYGEQVFTVEALFLRAKTAREMIAAKAAGRRDDTPVRIVGGSDKYIPRRKGGGAGITGRAGAVPQVMVAKVTPVAKSIKAAKKVVATVAKAAGAKMKKAAEAVRAFRAAAAKTGTVIAAIAPMVRVFLVARAEVAEARLTLRWLDSQLKMESLTSAQAVAE
jgi:enamine deaminase RidA (YjgF/YER057c/UK114 family)